MFSWMKNYYKIAFGVGIALSISRFIPHPPNFTSLIALSFYIPAAFGTRYIPVVVIALSITDLLIGFHSTILFTWGSVILIGLLSKYFDKSIIFRIFGALTGAVVFYSVTNFGVWLSGYYGYSFQGLLNSYILAIPFFTYSLLSTFIFASLIETICRYKYKHFL